ncbi:hypothetical protein V1524DRAFT_430577 [Lipomyces starkeyi]
MARIDRRISIYCYRAIFISFLLAPVQGVSKLTLGPTIMNIFADAAHKVQIQYSLRWNRTLSAFRLCRLGPYLCHSQL